MAEVAGIIERGDESEETNVAVEPKVEPTAVEPAPVVEHPEPTPEEPEFEIEGQRLKASQIKAALEAEKNKAEWQRSNTQKAQEIAEERRRLEAERQELLLGRQITERLKSNPDLARQIFTPPQVKDVDAEYAQHLQNRPADLYSAEYLQWDVKRDQLLRESAREDARRESETRTNRLMAEQANRETERDAVQKYVESGKLTPDEFKKSVDWVAQNFQAVNGAYPKNCLDVAYKVLFSDREVANAQLEASKKAAEAILKAKPANQSPGVGHEPKTDIDESDGLEADAFVKELRARIKK